jgi:hypothetical protein
LWELVQKVFLKLAVIYLFTKNGEENESEETFTKSFLVDGVEGEKMKMKNKK